MAANHRSSISCTNEIQIFFWRAKAYPISRQSSKSGVRFNPGEKHVALVDAIHSVGEGNLSPRQVQRMIASRHAAFKKIKIKRTAASGAVINVAPMMTRHVTTAMIASKEKWPGVVVDA